METKILDRKKLCRDAVNKIFKAAQPLAKKEFKNYPKQIQNELELNLEKDREHVLLNKFNTIKHEYQPGWNVRNIRECKKSLADFYISHHRIYREDFSFEAEEYEAQITMVKDQFLRLMKMDFLKEQLKNYEEEPVEKYDNIQKIKWLGSPSEFGVLIHELEKNGYIEKPLHKRDKTKTSWAGLAKLCSRHFFVPNQDRSGETSEENIRQEITDPSSKSRDVYFFKITRTNKNQ